MFRRKVVVEDVPEPVTPEPKRLPAGVAFRVRKSTVGDPDGEVRSWSTSGATGVRTDGPKLWSAWSRSQISYYSGGYHMSRPYYPTAYATLNLGHISQPPYRVALLDAESTEIRSAYLDSINDAALIEDVAARLWEAEESMRAYAKVEALVLGDYPPKILGGAS